MGVIATIEIGADDFALGSALADGPDLRIRLERVVPVDGRPVPYLWVDTTHLDAIESAFRDEADVASFSIVDTTDEEALLRVEWAHRVADFFELLCETDATVLEGVGNDGVWRLDLRFEREDELTAFHRRCTDRGIDVAVGAIHDADASARPGIDAELTATQRETLRLAYETGYFEVPRRINLVELAARLGVSDSAASQRLRRGTGTLLAATLSDERDR